MQTAEATTETGPRIGTRPVSTLGRIINRVNVAPFPCPVCHTGGTMYVHPSAVRWLCGHTRDLPPLKAAGT